MEASRWIAMGSLYAMAQMVWSRLFSAMVVNVVRVGGSEFQEVRPTLLHEKQTTFDRRLNTTSKEVFEVCPIDRQGE